MKKQPYTKTFKETFDDSLANSEGLIKRVSHQEVKQKLVIASSDKVLNKLKRVIND